MGALAGFGYRDIVKRLKQLGMKRRPSESSRYLLIGDLKQHQLHGANGGAHATVDGRYRQTHRFSEDNILPVERPNINAFALSRSWAVVGRIDSRI